STFNIEKCNKLKITIYFNLFSSQNNFTGHKLTMKTITFVIFLFSISFAAAGRSSSRSSYGWSSRPSPSSSWSRPSPSPSSSWSRPSPSYGWASNPSPSPSWSKPSPSPSWSKPSPSPSSIGWNLSPSSISKPSPSSNIGWNFGNTGSSSISKPSPSSNTGWNFGNTGSSISKPSPSSNIGWNFGNTGSSSISKPSPSSNTGWNFGNTGSSISRPPSSGSSSFGNIRSPSPFPSAPPSYPGLSSKPASNFPPTYSPSLHYPPSYNSYPSHNPGITFHNPGTNVRFTPSYNKRPSYHRTTYSPSYRTPSIYAHNNYPNHNYYNSYPNYGSSFGSNGLPGNTYIYNNYYGSRSSGGSPFLTNALFYGAGMHHGYTWGNHNSNHRRSWYDEDDRRWRATTKAPYFENKVPGSDSILPAAAVVGAATAFGLVSLLPLNVPAEKPLLYCNTTELYQTQIKLEDVTYFCMNKTVMISCPKTLENLTIVDECIKGNMGLENSTLLNASLVQQSNENIYTTNGTLFSRYPVVCNSTTLLNGTNLNETTTILNCYEGEINAKLASFIPTTTTEAPVTTTTEKSLSIPSRIHVFFMKMIGRGDALEKITTTTLPPPTTTDDPRLALKENDTIWAPEAMTSGPITCFFSNKENDQKIVLIKEKTEINNSITEIIYVLTETTSTTSSEFLKKDMKNSLETLPNATKVGTLDEFRNRTQHNKTDELNSDVNFPLAELLTNTENIQEFSNVTRFVNETLTEINHHLRVNFECKGSRAGLLLHVGSFGRSRPSMSSGWYQSSAGYKSSASESKAGTNINGWNGGSGTVRPLPAYPGIANRVPKTVFTSPPAQPDYANKKLTNRIVRPRLNYGSTFGSNGLLRNTYIYNNYYGSRSAGGSPFLTNALFYGARMNYGSHNSNRQRTWYDEDDKKWRATTKAPYFDNKVPGSQSYLPAAAVVGAATAFGLVSLLPLNVPAFKPLMYCNTTEIVQSPIMIEDKIYSCFNKMISITNASNVEKSVVTGKGLIETALECDMEKSNEKIFCTNKTLISRSPMVCNSTKTLNITNINETMKILKCYEGEIDSMHASFIPTTAAPPSGKNKRKEFSLPEKLQILFMKLIGDENNLESESKMNSNEKMGNSWIPEALTIPPEKSTAKPTKEGEFVLMKRIRHTYTNGTRVDTLVKVDEEEEATYYEMEALYKDSNWGSWYVKVPLADITTKPSTV
ncbi:CLUMA_CG007293, isoform A, partial [Clunio marinus]